MNSDKKIISLTLLFILICGILIFGIDSWLGSGLSFFGAYKLGQALADWGV
jgi:hypothetical protein